MPNLLDEYRWRGMLQDATEGAGEAFDEGSVTGYIGFDPTAVSLHVGNLLVIMLLVHMQRAGHSPIALVGGGTGLVGDPSGKSQERPLMSREDVERNLEGIRGQLSHFLDFEARDNPARMVNNLDWLGELSALDFLRDVGKHFSMNVLLRRETNRRRLEDEEVGMSYTEFSYSLLQAYDFLALYDRHGCTLQMGGSDQWGNIVAGVDLIRRVRGARAFGVVSPLVTTASGTKFGKTEEGTVWLDPALTSPFRFYQFWLNADDEDARRYLRYFTLLDEAAVRELDAVTDERPQERAAQKAVAREVTQRVHGAVGLAKAEQATRVLFGGEIEGLTADEVEEIFHDVPSSTLPREGLGGDGVDLVELLAETSLAGSRGDARRSIEGGGIYLNNVRVEDTDQRARLESAVEGRFLVLRKGKKTYHLVRLTG